MLVTTLDAKARLEAEGLHVSCNNAHGLWIAANVRHAGGIRLSDDACALLWDSGRWVAIFPAEGLTTYEVPGTLTDLVSLIAAVYRQYRQAGGAFRDAFRQVARDPEQYRVGRSLSGV